MLFLSLYANGCSVYVAFLNGQIDSSHVSLQISILSVPPHSLGERQIPVIAGIELDASSCCCPVGTCTYVSHACIVINGEDSLARQSYAPLDYAY